MSSRTARNIKLTKRTSSSPTDRSKPASRERLRSWCAAHPTALFALVSAVWVLLVYRHALAAPFVYDDISHVQQNTALLSWRGVFGYWVHAVTFTSSFRGSGGSSYRPLYWLSLAVDRAMWGLNPVGFHFTNLLLHWANGVLAFVLLRKLRVSLLVSAAATLLWLCLPINSEAVVWVAARAYLLMGCALLASLLAAVWYLRSRKMLAVGFFSLATLVALLAHEEGILILPLTLLVAYVIDRAPRREWLVLCGAGGGAAVVYFLLRRAAGTALAAGHASPWATGLAFLKYVRWMVLPVGMSVERSTDLPADRFSLAAVGAVALVLALLAAIVGLRKRAPEVAAGLLWMTVAILPFCGVIFIYQGMAERFDYLASLGFALAAASIAYREQGRWRDVALGCLVLWALWGVWRLEARVEEWRDPETLYEASLRATPRSAGMLVNLGDTYLQRGDAKQARWVYEQVLAIDPGYVGAIINLGAAYQQLGDRDAAEREYERAIALAPLEEGPHADLGALYFVDGKTDAALQQLTKATELNPSDATAYYDLGAIYQNTGRRDDAERMYEKVLGLKPNDPDTLRNLARLKEKQ